MKPKTLAIIAAFALIVLSAASCVTRETTTTYPDGTVRREKITEPAAGAVETGGYLAGKIIEAEK